MSKPDAHEPLFSAPVHRAMKWLWGIFLAFFLVALIDVALTVVFRQGRAPNLGSLSALWVVTPLLAVWFGIFHFFFRQKTVWGSAVELEVGRGKGARHVPWSRVSRPEWTWYSFRAPGALRVAFIEIQGEGGGRVYFYADESSMTKLCRMRDGALASVRAEQAPTDAVSPPAAIEFPFAFIPLVVALVAVAGLLGVVLRADNALVSVLSIAVVVVATVILVVAFSKPPRA